MVLGNFKTMSGKNRDFDIFRTVSLCVVGIFILSGCNSTPKPRDFPSSWRPVNQLSEDIQAIPLFKRYIYEVMPIDGTLKSLLTRWASDSKLTLQYSHCLDFTLPKGTVKIKTADLDKALMDLNELYMNQNIVVVRSGRLLIAEGGYVKSKDNQMVCN